MQYRTGIVSVTNASATVTLAGASTGADSVAAGDAFKVDRDNEVVYSISSRTPSSGPSITSLTISPAYGGVTGSGLNYQITQDFTPNRGYPELAQGDQDAADWLTKALRMIDADVAVILASGAALNITNNQVVFWNSGFKGSTNLTWDGTSFKVGTAGPHAIGTVFDAIQFSIGGTYTSATDPGVANSVRAFEVRSTINAFVSRDAYLQQILGTINKAGSGTHADFASLLLAPPTIGAGAAALTNASTLKITGAPTGATNNYAEWIAAGSVRWDSPGPHSIGGSVLAGVSLYLSGVFAGGGGITRGLQLDRTLTPAANIDGVGLYWNPSFTEAASGTHGEFVGAYFKIQSINAGAAALTNAAAVKIDAPPAGATNTYGLWMASGAIRIDSTGPHSIGGAAFSGAGLYLTGTWAGASGITTGLLMDTTLTPAATSDANGLYWNPSFTEAASGTHGDFVGAYFTIQAINAGAAALTNATAVKIGAPPEGATNTYALWVDSGRTRLDDAIALGGGAAPTLGTIGGSGPATAAQNEWLRIETQNGIRFLPCWA